jgi:hypothetical protein
MFEGTPSENIFEGSSEQEASNWINTTVKLGLKNAGENAIPEYRKWLGN